MVMTIVEGHLGDDKGADLEQTFARETADPSRLPVGLVESMLTHSTSDPTLWRILTVWESIEVLREMRRTNPVPAAIMMFRAAGAEPTVSIFEVGATVRR
jgi:hypothetical protein